LIDINHIAHIKNKKIKHYRSIHEIDKNNRTNQHINTLVYKYDHENLTFVVWFICDDLWWLWLWPNKTTVKCNLVSSCCDYAKQSSQPVLLWYVFRY